MPFKRKIDIILHVSDTMLTSGREIRCSTEKTLGHVYLDTWFLQWCTFDCSWFQDLMLPLKKIVNP